MESLKDYNKDKEFVTKGTCSICTKPALYIDLPNSKLLCEDCKTANDLNEAVQ